ncbi:MAG: MarR family transcriptional regulator [Thermoleophilia bacterium]|nr:MarR family transcriptional regulator [Thermoleophilia bacterium]
MSDQNALVEPEAVPRAAAPPEDRAIIDLLFRSGTSFDGYTAQMRRSFGINAHERLAIAALWERGPLTMTELGTWIPLSRAAVTTLVDRLEESALVVRRTDAEDRRRTVVHLTESATTRMEPVIHPWVDDALKMIHESGPEAWEAVKNFLERYQQLNRAHAEKLAAMTDEQIQLLAKADTTS